MQVQILNVGQGSCTILVSSTGEVIVIDGGDTTPARPDRLNAIDWFVHNGIDTVDHLILSHLHRDHAQGLLPLAQQLRVKTAVLPYPRFEPPVPDRDWLSGYQPNSDVDEPHGQYQLIIEYLQLMDAFDDQGTEIRYSTASTSTEPAVLWSTAPFQLIQLYPTGADTLVTPTLVRKLDRTATADLAERLHEVSENTNRDSAVFALCADDPSIPAVIIGGDLGEQIGDLGAGTAAGQASAGEQPQSTASATSTGTGWTTDWTTVLGRAQLQGCVWVLPHHGAPDGAAARHVAAIRPRLLIASVGATAAASYRKHWHTLEVALPDATAMTCAGATASATPAASAAATASAAVTASAIVVSTSDQPLGTAWTAGFGPLTISVGG